jgi:hypothetical protein
VVRNGPGQSLRVRNIPRALAGLGGTKAPQRGCDQRPASARRTDLPEAQKSGNRLRPLRFRVIRESKPPYSARYLSPAAIVIPIIRAFFARLPTRARPTIC